MKLPTNKRIKVSFVLTSVMLVVVLVELYFGYVYLYPNLNVSDDSVPVRDIVRVDLKSYQNTIDLLDSLQTYQPSDLNLPRSNPFK